MNTCIQMSVSPEAIRKLLNELEASRASRKRAWENLQEIRWILKDATGIDLPPPARKTIDLEGRVVKEGVRKIVNR
jgi:Arc/MetJ-type ribon-helix-helix transcriptional regulator